MIREIFAYAVGYAEIEVDGHDAAEMLNLLGCEKIVFADTSRGDETSPLRFTVYLHSVKRLKGAAERYGIEICVLRRHGVPIIIKKYRKRWGIAVGMLIFLSIISVSSLFIWDFEVSGNSTVPDEKIIAGLDALGCGVGSYIDGIDFDLLHNNFLLNNTDIAWIAVNMHGTRAAVEVREMKVADNTDIPKYANVIAAEDGCVQLIQTHSGRAAVKIGDTVRRGELLISGVITVREDGIRYDSASGKVYAEVVRTFKVSVPLENTKKIMTGEKIKHKSIKFFGNTVNLFGKSGIPYANYDTIETERQVTLLGRYKIPLWVTTTEFAECTDEIITLSGDEAASEAAAQFSKSLSETIGDGTLVEKEITCGMQDGEYVIDCTVRCVDDIGEIMPIRVNETPSQDGNLNTEIKE